MRSLSGVGLALTIVFGFLLLALLAEIYYLLWCKKRTTTTRHDLQSDYSTPATRELLLIFCCSNTTTNPSSSSSSPFSNPKPIEYPHQQQQEQEQQRPVDGFGNVGPRFLFTIMEETVEEMECEDGLVSTKGKSLNDLFLNMESGSTTPYLTPLASPSLFTPPFTTPLMDSCYNNGRTEGLTSFFESSTDAEFNRLVRSSPSSSYSASPLSTFKFLRDAEDKLYKRKVLEIDEEAKG